MFSAITKSAPTNHVFKILQPHHFIDTSTNPDDGHMCNCIRQNEINVANEPLKFEKFKTS